MYILQSLMRTNNKTVFFARYSTRLIGSILFALKVNKVWLLKISSILLENR